MTALWFAALAATGTHLLATSTMPRPPRSGSVAARTRHASRAWLQRVGLGGVDVREFVAVLIGLLLLGQLIGVAVFGAVGPSIAVGVLAASFPVGAYQARGRRRHLDAQETWPRLIEEIRVQTGSLGLSIPRALFHAGSKAPADLRPAFDAAHREWLLTTDLDRTISVLKGALADPTADMACETLLVAHEVGGTDLDRRLEALAVDRFEDIQGRKDARSRQASARFARNFVVVVPGGMALAGMSIGNGRSAYQSPTGQVVVLVALAMIAGCWAWAGRVMRLPENERVFAS